MTPVRVFGLASQFMLAMMLPLLLTQSLALSAGVAAWAVVSCKAVDWLWGRS